MLKQIAFALVVAWLCSLTLASGQSDFSTERLKQANNELDSTLVELKNSSHVSFQFSAEQRRVIITKYLRDSKGSSYFWTHFTDLLLENYKKTDCICFTPEPLFVRVPKTVVNTVRETESEAWGDLILESAPPGAEVFLGDNDEGQTKIARRYPENTYTFVVKMTGYKSKEVSVTIKKGQPVQETVTLEKQ